MVTACSEMGRKMFSYMLGNPIKCKRVALVQHRQKSASAWDNFFLAETTMAQTVSAFILHDQENLNK